jgi:hypothetical protein
MGGSFVTVAVDQEKNMANYENEEKIIVPGKYGCDILLEKTTVEMAKDSSFPSDAYLIWYILDEQEYIDLVRGARSRIFDMYYDKYGKGVVKKIDFGYGRTNPKLWGIKQPDKKKKR